MTSTASTRTSSTSGRRASTMAVVGAAFLAALVPVGTAHAQRLATVDARIVLPTLSGSTLDADSPTPVRTVVPCFIGHANWNDALAGPPPHCHLVP